MIEKNKLYSFFNICIDKTIEFYLISSSNITEPNIEYFKLMMFQYCLEMNKEVNIGASKAKEFTESDTKEFKRVSKIAMERAIKNYRDPIYNIPINWSKSTIDLFEELSVILVENLKKYVNIRLKALRKRKERKK